MKRAMTVFSCHGSGWGRLGRSVHTEGAQSGLHLNLRVLCTLGQVTCPTQLRLWEVESAFYSSQLTGCCHIHTQDWFCLASLC